MAEQETTNTVAPSPEKEPEIPHCENKYEFGAYAIKNIFKVVIALAALAGIIVGVMFAIDKMNLRSVKFFGVEITNGDDPKPK
jgi:hypothetical protein